MGDGVGRLEALLARMDGELERALLRAENRLRAERKEPPLAKDTPVYLPGKSKDRLRLVNLSVWSRRYCVSLEFTLEVLLRYFHNVRTVNGRLTLGIAASSLTGPRARKVLQEAIHRTYPNRENYRAAAQSPPPPPISHLAYNTPEEFVHAYGEAMHRRRQKASVTETASSRRRFRG